MNEKLFKIGTMIRNGKISSIESDNSGWGRVYMNGQETALWLTPIEMILLRRMFS